LVDSLLGLEDLALVLALVRVELDSAEVVVADSLWDAALEVELGRSGNNVLLVDSSEWHTVDLEWAGDQEEARLELLQEHDSLAAVSASDQDEDRAWDNAFLELLGGSVRFTGAGGFEASSLGVSWVESLGSSDLSGLLSCLLLNRSGPSLSLVEDLLGVASATGVLANSLIRHF